MSIFGRVLHSSVLSLTRAACVFALLGLGLMAYSLLDARAIPVIVAMSVGHGFGFAAFGCYLLAIVLDARRNRAAEPTPPRAKSAPDTPVDSSN